MVSLPLGRPRWDLVVRITHWGIAAGVIANRLLTEGGSAVHLWIGYAVAVLLVLRLTWGFAGSEPARFTSFLPSPTAALRHLRDINAGRSSIYRSHNPLGALMCYALWATLLAVAVTGITMARLPSVTSPTTPLPHVAYAEPHLLASNEDGEAHEGQAHEDGEEGMIGEIHELAANLLLALAIAHIAGVAFESGRGERGLVRAMITGDRDHG